MRKLYSVILAVILIIIVFLFVQLFLTEQQKPPIVSELNTEEIISFLEKLSSKIKNVTDSGIREGLSVDFPGLWRVDSISDFVEFKIGTYNISVPIHDEWISVNSLDDCLPSLGKFGTNRIDVICEKIEDKNGYYEITYRLYYRELEDYESNTYKINLEGGTSSHVKNIFVEKIISEEMNPKIKINFV